MRRTGATITAVLAAATLMLAGCASGGENDGGTAAPADAGSPSTSAAASPSAAGPALDGAAVTDTDEIAAMMRAANEGRRTVACTAVFPQGPSVLYIASRSLVRQDLTMDGVPISALVADDEVMMWSDVDDQGLTLRRPYADYILESLQELTDADAAEFDACRDHDDTTVFQAPNPAGYPVLSTEDEVEDYRSRLSDADAPVVATVLFGG